MINNPAKDLSTLCRLYHNHDMAKKNSHIVDVVLAGNKSIEGSCPLSYLLSETKHSPSLANIVLSFPVLLALYFHCCRQQQYPTYFPIAWSHPLKLYRSPSLYTLALHRQILNRPALLSHQSVRLLSFPPRYFLLIVVQLGFHLPR